MPLRNANQVTGRRSTGFARPLRLECLEDRNGPSLLVGYPDAATTDLLRTEEDAPSAPAAYSSPKAGEPGENQKPKITGFSAVLANGMWTFTGTVVDENPGGLTVTFGGSFEPVSGKSVVTNANGQFTITVPANGGGGIVNAATTDAQGQASTTVYCTI